MTRCSIYTRELADEICKRLAHGESLRGIARALGISYEVIRFWADQDRDGFRERYERARDMCLEYWADEIVDIADDGSNDWIVRNDGDNPGYQVNGDNVQRSRLRVDVRKWLLSRLKPHRYGDRVSHEHGSNPERPMITQVNVVVVDPQRRDT